LREGEKMSGDMLRVSKVNELAKQLVKHGIATSMDEAVNQAQQFLGEDSYERIKEAKSPEQMLKEDEAEVKSTTENKEFIALKNKIENQDSMIIEMQKKMNEMISEINFLEDAIKKILEKVQNQSSKPVLKVSQTTTGSTEEIDYEPTHQSVKTDETKPTPRTGNYTPENIRIEDFFYYGNKKK
jgi:predicted RNase H-like nuclease (RuvC/YqgF family)